MTSFHSVLTQGSAARTRANAAAVLLAAAGAPLVFVLGLMTGSRQLLYLALPVLALALLAIDAAEARRRRAVTPMVAAGLVLLLIIAAPFLVLVVTWAADSQMGLVFGSPIGCVGLAGLAASWRWWRRGGSGWFGALGGLGGLLNLMGAVFCVMADSVTDTGDDWAALGYVLLGCFCSIAGCVLMLSGAIAMLVSLHRSAASGDGLWAGVRSSATYPAGGW